LYKNETRIQPNISSIQVLKMKSKVVFFFIVLICGSPTINSQSVHEIECEFQFDGISYSCEIRGQTIPDDENLSFVFTGNHLQNRENADVEMVKISFSNFPYIPTQIFSAFPNLRGFFTSNAKVQRLRPFNFANGRNLRLISFEGERFTEFPANVFSGATNVSSLNINRSELRTIADGSFSGLSSVQWLLLNENKISSIAPNAFVGLTSVLVIDLSMNELEVLDGRILATKPQLRAFAAESNRIREIGRDIFSGLNRLSSVNLRNNVCINWTTEYFDKTTESEKNERLQPCFV
jgi:Leucine-rich repeat (LRR) protein